MILVDTSIWVDHLRRPDKRLSEGLIAGDVLAHPLVIGELACGVMPKRAEVLALMHELPRSAVASHAEVLNFIERHELAGRGVGYVDIHLLAAALMTPPARLWTRDRQLHVIAVEMALAFDGARH